MTVLGSVRERALGRPVLLAPLLGGVAAQFALESALGSPTGAGVMLKVVLGTAWTLAITTVFAELWLGDGLKVDLGRLLETAAVFLLPLPLLLAFSAASTVFVYALLHNAEGRLVVAMVYATVILGKLLAFVLGAVSALAAARRREADGAWAALKLGARSALGRPAFLGLLLFIAYLVQETCAIGLSSVLGSAFAATPETAGVFRFLGRFLSTAVPLFGCVAAPIEAWRAGKLGR